MQDTAGKRLSKARHERGLSVEEVAHATHIRPDKVLALENGDYSRFGSNAYAKGFLLIYARFLKIDVGDESRSLETFTDLHVRDYQYLNNVEAPPKGTRQRVPVRHTRPSVAPLVIFVLLVFGVGFGYYINLTAKRLGTFGSPAAPTPAPNVEPLEPAPKQTPVVAPLAVPAQAPEVAATAPAGTEPVGNPVASTPPSAQAKTAIPENTEVRRAEPVSSAAGELAVGVKRKTWVKICRDDPHSRPVFMDYLYPDASPLKLRGGRFFITARDPAAIEVHKNGVPVAYQPGSSVQ